ncbi:nucleocapsid protein [Meliandou praomys virus]|uniref:Nucleocapsid n=1 Tax=Meliandou praomys virus TaxID=2940988 RepID=A0AAE9KXB7_9MONO|nr:nucleocapsid protein [Meliandou praomys virus]
MSRLGIILDEFREFKNNPPRKGLISSALHGLKKSVIIPVPVFNKPEQRWFFTVYMLQIVWSEIASGSMITGALISILSLFAENPGAMIRTLLNDPDLDVQIAEVASADENGIKLATRGKKMDEYEAEIMRVASRGPGRSIQREPYPFVRKEPFKMITRTTEDLQIAIQTILIQIWILLPKAVTATDTAQDSERRRWNKFSQQRRAEKDYKLEDSWLNYTRARMAEDISVRRYMVEILIETGKMSGVKSRVIEAINDIGNYVSETGMAGFFLTIKYGIETKYPALALNELQADLSTVLSLMKLYTELGERAPFMVILEDSVQTRFAPGNYPLLWSYAMGVGSLLDRAVNNLNYTRPYMEHSFFRLGEVMVEKLEGTVNNKIAAELELTQEQIDSVKSLVRADGKQSTPGAARTTQKGAAARPMTTYEAEDIIPQDKGDMSEYDDDDNYDPARNKSSPNSHSLFYQPSQPSTRKSTRERREARPQNKNVNSLKESLNSAIESIIGDEMDDEFDAPTQSFPDRRTDRSVNSEMSDLEVLQS